MTADSALKTARWMIRWNYGPALHAPTLKAYVNDFGLNLAQDLGAADRVRQFEILNSARATAMALSDGTIYVTRGLLTLLNNEDELAAVLAHEIGHLASDHQLSRDQELDELFAAAGLEPSDPREDWTCDGDCQDQYDLALKALNRRLLGYELEADAFALGALLAVGRSPEAAGDIVKRVSAYRSMPEGRNALESSYPNSAYASHPAGEVRAAALERQLAARPAQAVEGKGPSLEFLLRIEGLGYSHGSQEPYFLGSEYVNPKKGFRVRWPDGFVVRESGDKLLGERSDGTRVSVVGPRFAPEDPEALLRKNSLFFDEVESLERESLDGNTLLRFTVLTRPKGIRARCFVLIVPGEHWKLAFYFFGSAFGRDPASFDALLLEVVSRFEYFLPGRYAPTPRVSIAEVKPGDTQASLAARMVLNDGLELERFRILNGLSPDKELRPGQFLKLVVAPHLAGATRAGQDDPGPQS